MCDDGLDDDFDGPIDCFDPDCGADPACTEDCTDGLDDNGNGAVDCQDFACAADPACASVCPELTLAGALPISLPETTLGRNDAQQGSCATGTGGADLTFSFTAPAAGDYTFDTAGSAFDTVVYVLDACGGTEIACNDDVAAPSDTTSAATATLAAKQTVVVVVDGDDAAAFGDFTLTVSQ